MEHVLIQDDDGHWYVCPADKADEACRVLAAITAYWGGRDYDGDPPGTPEYLRPVGGSPSLVKFTGFRIS